MQPLKVFGKNFSQKPPFAFLYEVPNVHKIVKNNLMFLEPKIAGMLSLITLARFTL